MILFGWTQDLPWDDHPESLSVLQFLLFHVFYNLPFGFCSLNPIMAFVLVFFFDTIMNKMSYCSCDSVPLLLLVFWKIPVCRYGRLILGTTSLNCSASSLCTVIRNEWWVLTRNDFQCFLSYEKFNYNNPLYLPKPSKPYGKRARLLEQVGENQAPKFCISRW